MIAAGKEIKLERMTLASGIVLFMKGTCNPLLLRNYKHGWTHERQHSPNSFMLPKAVIMTVQEKLVDIDNIKLFIILNNKHSRTIRGMVN
jgi:hypothetical protein